MSIKELHQTIVAKLHKIIVLCLQQTAHVAVIRPRLVVLITSAIGILCILIGCTSNFYIETDEVKLWTPYHSNALKHGEWLKNKSGFQMEKAQLQLIIHRNGENILGRECIDYSFKAVNVVKSIQGLNDSRYISGVVNFFNDDHDLFRKMIHSDEEAIIVLSFMPFFPNGNLVRNDELFGFPSKDRTGKLHSVLSYMVSPFLNWNISKDVPSHLFMLIS